MEKGMNVQEMLDEVGIVETLKKAREVAKDYVYDLRNKGRISFSDPIKRILPSIHIVRKTLPEAWEDISMALLGIGQEVHSHYDSQNEKGEYQSFPTMEATVMTHIEEPFAKTRFHKHFLGGWLGFGDYKAEIEGVKDHWVMDPQIVVDMMRKGRFNEIKNHTGWLYSYSQRLNSYPYLDIEGNSQVINQLQSVIDNLTKNPTSRSAQCTTWDPRWDHNDGQMKESSGEKAVFDDYHAPCLQRLWFRLSPDEKGFNLDVNTDWRSRCHLKAFPQNIYGITEGIVEPIRAELEKSLNVPIKTGRYVDISSSLHIYGHYLDTRRQGLDAQAYLQDVFKISEGEPLEKRLILPGTSLYEMMEEELAKEYKFRKENPDFGKN